MCVYIYIYIIEVLYKDMGAYIGIVGTCIGLFGTCIGVFRTYLSSLYPYLSSLYPYLSSLYPYLSSLYHYCLADFFGGWSGGGALGPHAAAPSKKIDNQPINGGGTPGAQDFYLIFN